MKKQIMLAMLTLISMKAFSADQSTYMQVAKCSVLSLETKRITKASILVDMSATGGDSEEKGLIIYKDLNVQGKDKFDMATEVQIIMKNLMVKEVVLLGNSAGQKLIFDKNGNAKLVTEAGKFNCSLINKI
jgi:hypothetical protein